MAKQTVVIEQDPKSPVSRPILAQAITDISNAFVALRKSGLNRKAIVVLVAHSSQQRQYVVESVLDALEQLKKNYAP